EQADESKHEQQKHQHISDSFHPSRCQSTRYARTEYWRSTGMNLMRKKIPAGSVFQRTYRDKNGTLRKTATWFVHYYANRKPVRVATGTETVRRPSGYSAKDSPQVSRYSEYSEQVELVPINQLLDLVIEDYRFNKRASTYDAELRIEKHLRPFFGD